MKKLIVLIALVAYYVYQHCTFTCSWNWGGKRESFCSVAPSFDRYYQRQQGYLGDNLLSGYAYYNAY